jgi:tetratricopeptide (TPR) repeat protein
MEDAGAEAFRRGVEHAEAGRREEAEAAYRRAIALGVTDAYLNLGNLLREDGERDDEAEGAYRAAIENGDHLGHYNLALLLTDNHRRDEAECEFRSAIAAGDEAAHGSYGTFLRDAGRFDEALEQLSLAVEDDEERWSPARDALRVTGAPAVWNGLAHVLRGEDEDDLLGGAPGAYAQVYVLASGPRELFTRTKASAEALGLTLRTVRYSEPVAAIFEREADTATVRELADAASETNDVVWGTLHVYEDD